MSFDTNELATIVKHSPRLSADFNFNAGLLVAIAKFSKQASDKGWESDTILRVVSMLASNAKSKNLTHVLDLIYNAPTEPLHASTSASSSDDDDDDDLHAFVHEFTQEPEEDN